MRENTEAVVDWIIEDEGGFTTSHGLDGATNYGITLGFLKDVRKKQGQPPPTVQELKDMTKQEAASIYENFILSEVEFNKLPSGLDYVMANTATMEGNYGAKKLLQEVLGVNVDADWGEKTWKAINEADPGHISAKVLLFQLREKMKDSRVRKYGKGWANRSIILWDRVSSLINKRPTKEI